MCKSLFRVLCWLFVSYFCFIKMDDLQLIKLVESNKIVYDKLRPDYKDKNKQNKAWQNIADTMGYEGKLVKYFCYYHPNFTLKYHALFANL